MKKIAAIAFLAVVSPSVLAGFPPPPPPTNLPEPSTWLLFGAAAIAVLALKKFKK